jgi:hypothetical protein
LRHMEFAISMDPMSEIEPVATLEHPTEGSNQIF